MIVQRSTIIGSLSLLTCQEFIVQPGQCQDSSAPAGSVEDFSNELIFEDLPANCSVDQVSASIGNEDDLVLQNLAQFCMRLEYHYLIPETVVQYVFQEMSHVYSHGLAYLSNEIRRQMELENIPSEKIQHIMFNAFKNDPFTKSLNNDLRSEHMRKEFYKRTFPFVEPQKIEFVRAVKSAGGKETWKKTFFYYIPIKETLQASFLDKSLNLKLTPAVVRHDGLLCDVTDGKVFLESQFFRENPLALRIVIYQDGVEIVNPLGPGKRKHKVLAIYLSILNLPDHVRSAN